MRAGTSDVPLGLLGAPNGPVFQLFSSRFTWRCMTWRSQYVLLWALAEWPTIETRNITFKIPSIFSRENPIILKMLFLSFDISIILLAALLNSVFANAARHGANVGGIGVPISNSDATNIIPNRYIVVYNSSATTEAVDNHQASVMSALRRRSLSPRAAAGRQLSDKMDMFSMSGWRGMSLDADDGMILEIASAEEVLKPVFFRHLSNN